MLLRKTFRFEASHILPKHPGKCSRLHGHSWVLHIFVEGSVNPDTGFVMDFADISKMVNPLIDRLDHHHLGTYDDFGSLQLNQWGVLGMPHDIYPTSENLLTWIGKQLTLDWSILAIEETCTSYAELTRKECDLP